MIAALLRSRFPTLVFSLALVTACQRPSSTPGVKSRANEAAPHGPSNPGVSPPELVRISRMSAATRAERDYFLYLPSGYRSSGDGLWPVLLFLHGNGERGDAKAELDYLLQNGPLYEAWIQKRDLPFLIVVPQLPMYGRDATADYLRNRTRAQIPVRLAQGVPERPARFATPEPMKGALAEDLDKSATPYGPPMGWPELEADLIGILDDVIRTQRGDPKRQYLTGLSYGGYGTWYMASKYPDRFAAIVPVVGYGHPDSMQPIAAAKLPIWCFAGGRDGGVHPKYFYPAFNRLEALGHKDFRFTIEADMGHDVWARTYAGNDVYDWLLAHRK
jgi:predicted peptidase